MPNGDIIGTLSPILGIEGTLAAVPDAELVGELSLYAEILEPYAGPYVVTPLARISQILPTAGKRMEENVVVLEVPYYETSNLSDGLTVYIAETIGGG